MTEELITVKELAELWRVSPEWIYDNVTAGHIPCVRLGRHVRFRPADLATYLEDNTVPQHPKWRAIRP